MIHNEQKLIIENIYNNKNRMYQRCRNFGSYNLKEASETRYWIEIMIQSGIIPEKKFSSMIDEINRIIRILISTIKKLKDK